MTKRNRNTRILAGVGAAALLLLLAAGPALAVSAVGDKSDPDQRRQAMRESQIRAMDIFARNYGNADWSLVLQDVEANPADPGNAAFMSVPLSLANVYLNRYEAGGDKNDLDRSLAIFEWVVAAGALWGGRDGSGAVVSYLDIGLARVRSECDVGGFESRIDALWGAAMAVTAEEADALLLGTGVRPCGPDVLLAACTESMRAVPVDEEELASRAALFAAASSFLASDPRAQAWAEGALSLAAQFPASACTAAETDLLLSQGALAKRLGGGAGGGLDEGSGGGKVGRVSVSCLPFSTAYETAGPVDAVTPGDSLARAIADSRIVSFYLTERYLWLFPPGSQCELEGGN